MMYRRFSAPLRAARRSARAAFTLIEILVALAILGLLVGLAVNNFDNIFGGAQETTAELFVKESVTVPLTSYRMHLGDYPTSSEGLQALLAAPASKAGSWRGPYLKEGAKLTDPWGRPYQYRYPGTKNKTSPDIWSMGRDGQDGTADDIGNWAKASVGS